MAFTIKDTTKTIILSVSIEGLCLFSHFLSFCVHAITFNVHAMKTIYFIILLHFVALSVAVDTFEASFMLSNYIML